jgi:hypothetical protein
MTDGLTKFFVDKIFNIFCWSFIIYHVHYHLTCSSGPVEERKHYTQFSTIVNVEKWTTSSSPWISSYSTRANFTAGPSATWISSSWWPTPVG